MDIESIVNNLPKNMHPVDRERYLKTRVDIIERETTGINTHELEFLRNHAFNLILPYVLNSNYTGL